ncbi:MAG TPA: type I methionyl aminopeptidase [Nocardioidaceae bacterium]|nr:type I methionyl aminopeptidase [Nocardioidaceae bacterium]
MLFHRGIEIKTPAQIDAMRVAGLVVGETLQLLAGSVRSGMTTEDLDSIAEERIRASGAVPSFKGYHGFPGSICVSVNDEVVHGIPGERVIRDGDVVSIDCGAIAEGWHGDAAITVAVGDVPPETRRLMDVTEQAMWAGIAAASLGGRVGDISHAVESHVRSRGAFGIVQEYVGHGIGSAMHQPPNVPNYGRPRRGPKLVEGLALAVEPMIVAGRPATHVLADDWTVKTDDGSLAAHFENTFTLMPDGAWVLTALDGGEAELKARGVPFGGR